MQLPLLVFIFPAKLRAVTYTAEIIWNGGRSHLLNGLIIELSLTIHVWNYLSITWEAMLSASMEWNILWRDQCGLWKHRNMCMYVTWTRSRVYSEIFFLLRTHLRNYALYPLWFGFFSAPPWGIANMLSWLRYVRRDEIWVIIIQFHLAVLILIPHIWWVFFSGIWDWGSSNKVCNKSIWMPPDLDEKELWLNYGDYGEQPHS